jgi:hypothetical protein
MSSHFTLPAMAAALALSLVASVNAQPSSQTTGLKVAQASDDSGSVRGQATSDAPTMGAGSRQIGGANSGDQGGTGVKASAQGEGATNKDTGSRD